MKETILAISVLTTTIVGVGIFGLPYVSAQAGFLLALIMLIVLSGIMLLIHLYYGEIVLSTKEERQFPGYAGQYLGGRAKKIIGIIAVMGFYGTLLAYMIIGGDFLNIIFSPIINLPNFLFSIIFFALASTIICFGIKFISVFNFLLGLFLIIIVLFLTVFGFKNIDFNNLSYIHLNNIHAPYGVILFALMGMAVIPEIGEVLKRDKRNYKKIIIWGTLIPAVLYLLFIFSVVGVSGIKTSPDAISGLLNIMGKNIVFLGAMLGFMTTFTSYLGLGFALKETFVHDFRVNRIIALILLFVPIVLFALDIRNFVLIISIIGALLGAFECTAIVLIHKKIKLMGNQEPEYRIKHFKALGVIMIIIFIVGLAYSLLNMI